MGNRLAPILAIVALLIPVMAQALGLGDIVMKSALNQPLDAEIELISVEPGDAEGLKVGLASAEDFARVGAERSYFLTKIKFNVEKKPDGTPYIHLTTREPVTEPFLDFVVEARWPRGRLLREFTVLVDPPLLSEEKPAPVQPATVQATPATSSTTRQAPVAERATLRPVVSREGGLSYGPVRPNDTLWEIANRLRPDDSITVNQMMLALLRDNPQAFYNGNVNLLKAGYVLRIKDPASITAISPSEADAEIERQRAEWQARRSGRPLKRAVASAAATGAGSTSTTGAGGAAVAPKASLKLVAPGSEGAGSGAGEGDVAQLRQDLVLAAEALDATRQETEELKARLSEMEKQMQAMQRLITLKDDEMLALQQQLGGESPAAQPATEGAEAATPVETETPASEAPSATSEAAPAATPAPAALPAEAPAAAPTAAPAATPEPSLLDNPLLIYGGLGAIVLAIVGLVVVRRRKMQDGFQESILNVGEGAGPDSAAVAASAAAAGGESSMVSDFAMSEISDMSGIQTDNAEVDPIAEADVYLAYGRHQQAEEIIRDAMEKAPERNDLKLKMLEIYFATKDVENFEKQAQELHDALGDENDPLWAKAVTMGSQLCPGNPLFGGVSAEHLQEELASSDKAGDEDLLDFDFDLDSSALDEGEKSTAADESGVFDLDAEMEKMGVDSGPAKSDSAVADAAQVDVAEVVAESKPPQDDNGLDFDVSSLDFNLKTDETETVAEAGEDQGLDFDLQSLDESLAGEAEKDTAKADEGLDFDFETESVDETPTDEIAFELDESALAQQDESTSETAASAETEDVAKMVDEVADEAIELDLQDMGAEQGLEEVAVTEEAVDITVDDLEMPDLSLTEATLEEGVERDLASAEPEPQAEDALLDEDIFAEVDEIGTKLDLARAYVDMGDNDGARSILDEVLEEGDAEQQQQAKELLEKMA